MTKDLSKQLGISRLSFAEPEYMEKYLDITPGSVSVLGLMNDKDRGYFEKILEAYRTSSYGGKIIK